MRKRLPLLSKHAQLERHRNRDCAYNACVHLLFCTVTKLDVLPSDTLWHHNERHQLGSNHCSVVYGFRAPKQSLRAAHNGPSVLSVDHIASVGNAPPEVELTNRSRTLQHPGKVNQNCRKIRLWRQKGGLCSSCARHGWGTTADHGKQ